MAQEARLGVGRCGNSHRPYRERGPGHNPGCNWVHFSTSKHRRKLKKNTEGSKKELGSLG